MKKLVILIVITVVLVSLLSGCSNTLTANIVESDNPDQITVTLEENPTTGYSWTYTINDESVLKLSSDKYNEPEGDLAGAGGTHDFVFQGINDGEAEVTFKYERSFEENSAESVLVYKFTVNDKVPVLVDIVAGDK